MTAQAWFRDLVFAASGLSVGLALWLTYVRAKELVLKMDGRWVWAHMLADLGYAFVIGTLLLTIRHVPTIEPTTYSVSYTLGLVISAVGFLGIALEIRSVHNELKGDS